MIHVPDELKKLNSFKHIEIPSPEKMFLRNGYVAMSPNAFTGDEVAHIEGNKIDEIAAYADLNDQYLHAESVKIDENGND